MEITTNFLKENVNADKIIKSKGIFKFKDFFYYKHGKTAESFKVKIVKELNKLGINSIDVIDYFERWQAWPKDSWFEVSIKIN